MIIFSNLRPNRYVQNVLEYLSISLIKLQSYVLEDEERDITIIWFFKASNVA